jgi:serine protease Do
MFRKNLFFLSFLAMTLLISINSASFALTENDENNIVLLDKTAKAFAAVIKKAKIAVVSVQVEKSLKGGAGGQMPFEYQDPFEFFNDPFFEKFFGPNSPHSPKRSPQKFKQMGQGSGFLISNDGYILTNNHVVADADVIKVKLSDGREFKAKTIGTDSHSDVAVIKIEGKDFPYVTFGDSDKLEIGEWVIAIGNPFGLQQTVTVGVVSAKGRSSVGINDYEDFIQTDAAINPGNSGGPLLNIYGEVIGMNTAIFSKSGGYMGIGFAIPINMAKSIKDQLINKGKVTRGWLGVNIQNMDDELAKSFNMHDKKGILVADVTHDSPAEKSGLKQGDIIIKVNGSSISDVAELRNKIALFSPGTNLSIEIIRDNKPMNLNIVIGEQPSDLKKASGADSGAILEKLGFSVQDLTPQFSAQFGYKMGKGVIVSEVVQGSPAFNVGIKAGSLIEEINRQPVKDIKDFMIKLAAIEKDKRVLFRVKSGNSVRYTVISWE